jgi:hypothetical protein
MLSVARLLDVLAGRQNQPQVVVVEVAADLGVALLRQRLVLVVAGPVGQLGRRDVQDALARAPRDHVHEAEQVLVAVAVAHAAADAGFVHAGRAAHVERRHALVLVPHVQHAVGVRVRALGLEVRQQVAPHRAQLGEGGVDGARLAVLVDDGLAHLLVHHVQRVVLGLLALLDVRQDEREGLFLPGRQVQIDLVRADGVPAKGLAVRALAGKGNLGVVQALVDAHEGVAAGVETVHRTRAREQRVVVAALAVFGLVVNRAAVDLDLADRVGALQVVHVVGRVEQAELLETEDLGLLGDLRLVANRDLPQLQILAGRHEEQHLDFQAVLLPDDARVAEAVAALVGVELGLDGLPARVPHRPAVVHVDVATAQVVGHVVVPVAREATQLGVLPERVPTRRVRAQPEELVLPQVVQPRQRRIRPSDHIFALAVVEMAKGIHLTSARGCRSTSRPSGFLANPIRPSSIRIR